jgi:hypothetical protein
MLNLRIGISGAGEQTVWLDEYRSSVEFVQAVQPCTLSFPSVKGTAGRRIVLEIRISATGAHRHRLLQHDPSADTGRRLDYYPEGNAAFNLRRRKWFGCKKHHAVSWRARICSITKPSHEAPHRGWLNISFSVASPSN